MDIIIEVDGQKITIPSQSQIRITTSLALNTYIYVGTKGNKLVFEGGASLIDSIRGEGMKEKIK